MGPGGPGPLLKNHNNIGSLSNSGPDPLNNHKASNVGPSLASQRIAIKMAFRWRADGGWLIVVFGPFLPSSTKTKLSKLDPPLINLS